MKYFFNFVVIFCLGFSTGAFAQVQKYDETTRQKLLTLKDNPPKIELVIKGDTQSNQVRALVEFYKEKIFPQSLKTRGLFFKVVALRLLIDSGSQLSDEESKAWQKEYLEGSGQFNALAVDESWTATLKEFAQLAEGISAPLADDARRMWKERQRSVFAVEMKPKMDLADQYELEFEVASNEAPSGNKLSEFMTEVMGAIRSFKEGKITFKEATEIINKNYLDRGYHFIGYEAVQKTGENLNKLAIIRTELAKSKGFPTWSAYVLAGSGDGYTEKYRGLTNQRELLVKVIGMIKPVLNKLYEDRMKILGIDPKDMRAQYIALLRPKGLQQLVPYFPAEKISAIWEETMVESGFSPEVLSQILVDDSVTREKKNKTMAYLMPWYGPYTDAEELDVETLSFKQEPLGSPAWRKGFVYILQSYKTGGLGDLETAFHEGGHALEKVTKYKTIDTDEAYGYVETPSMTMERFLSDLEFIFNKAQAVDGVKPTREEIQELLEGEKMLNLGKFMSLMTTSLFDLDLWNYDYTKPKAQTFVERVKFLEGKIDNFAGPGYPDVESKIPFFYDYVSSTHYTSGSVRNIGYLFAEAASTMMADFLYDELEKSTGRRTWYKQPELAKILVDKFYSQGWKTTFPENIEGITGRKYDPESIIAQTLQDALDCQSRLVPQK